MFDELEAAVAGGEEQQIQEAQQEEIPIEGDFGVNNINAGGGNTSSGDEIDDILGDAPILPDDDDEIMNTITTTPKTNGSAEENGVKNEEKGEDQDYDDDDEPPIAPTHLGNAIDSLMMHWCQLLTNVSVKAPVPPPSTLDHVKEVAEVCSKHFRDASVDVNNEFTRLGVQWEMEQPMERSVIEDANLDEAIERQNRLIESAKEILRTRLELYNQENHDAGKQFTT